MNMLFKDKLVAVLRGFSNNEQGAVAIDWVMLTAGIVVTSIAAMSLFRYEKVQGQAITPQCEDGNLVSVSSTGGPIMYQLLGKIDAMIGGFTKQLKTGNGCS